jgi:hypothetical protein
MTECGWTALPGGCRVMPKADAARLDVVLAWCNPWGAKPPRPAQRRWIAVRPAGSPQTIESAAFSRYSRVCEARKSALSRRRTGRRAVATIDADRCRFPSFMRLAKLGRQRKRSLRLDHVKIRSISSVAAIHSAAMLSHDPGGGVASTLCKSHDPGTPKMAVFQE